MWVIERAEAKLNALSRVEAIERPVVDSLVARWQKGGAPAGPNDPDEARAQAFLCNTHTHQRWLGCDCAGEQAPMPVLFVVRLQSGRYALRRSFQHPLHHTSCPFHWDEGLHGGRAILAHTRRKQGAEGKTTPDFLLFAPAREEVAAVGAQPEQSRRRGARILSPLRQRLDWLAANAGNLVIAPAQTEQGVTDQMRLLRECASTVPMVDTVMLSEVFWTNENWFSKGWSNSAARTLMAERWPSRVRMQGYLVVMVRAVQENRIATLNGTITVHGRVECLAKDGPMMGLIALRWDEQTSRFDAASACVVSRLPRSGAPLGTDLDRQVAALLQWAAAKELLRGRTLHVRRVPITDVESAQPDFMIECAGRELAILVVDDEAIRPAKDRVSKALLERDIESVCYDATQPDLKEASKAAVRAIFEWCAQ